MLARFGMFRFGPTWEEAFCMFEQNGLEAILARFGMCRFGPTWGEVLCMFDQHGLEAMLECFRMFRFGPAWEEALCAFDKSGLEAMLACFGMCRFGPTWEEALCMFEQNGLEAMLAYFLRFRPGTILIRPGRRVAPVAVGLSAFDFSLLSGAGPRCWSPRANQALKFLVDHFLCYQSCSMFCPCFGRPLSLHVARIAARHLLDVTRDESDAVRMTFTEIP